MAFNLGEPSYQSTLAAAKVGKRQFEAAQGLLEALYREAAGRSAASNARWGRYSMSRAQSVKANYQLGLRLARMGKRKEADQQIELAKSLRQEDETTSRLQLGLLEPDR